MKGEENADELGNFEEISSDSNISANTESQSCSVYESFASSEFSISSVETEDSDENSKITEFQRLDSINDVISLLEEEPVIPVNHQQKKILDELSELAKISLENSLEISQELSKQDVQSNQEQLPFGISFRDEIECLVNTTKKIEQYTFGKQLGFGAYGIVYQATNDVGQEVAVKIQKLTEQSEKEVEFMNQLQHNNILHLLDTFIINNRYDFTVTELAEDGTLEDLMFSTKLDEPTIAKYVISILEGLKYLDEKEIAWMDLKPANILLKNGQVKLMDFGMSLYHSEIEDKELIMGTPHYIAPEMGITGKPHKRSDIWSLGITIIYMLTNTLPYDDLSGINAVNAIAEYGVQIPVENVSQDLRSFLSIVLTTDPEKRPSAETLLYHPWIQRYL